MEALAECKLLDFNISKSSYMLIGSKKACKDLESGLIRTPVTLCGKQMKRDSEAKYLGDWIHQAGLAESVASTIEKRKHSVLSSIRDIRNVVDDVRSSICGGLVSGLQIWEIAVVPMVLYNAECWLGINQKSIDILEELQRKFLRNLLAVGSGCPTPSLYWETGTTLMKFRILAKKLNFLHHLHNLPDGSLAKEILDIQSRLDYHGLYQECKVLAPNLPFSSIQSVTKFQWKKIVSKEIVELNKLELVKLSKNYKKICYKEDSDFKLQSYMAELDVSAARMRFKIATKMVPTIQMNFKSDPIFTANLWTCPGCSLHRDTQEHVSKCPAYADIRKNLDLEKDVDLCTYFKEVIKLRSMD